jgi:hypothetical protein
MKLSISNLKFALRPPDFLSSNSDAARIAGLSVRFECDDAGANRYVIGKPKNYLGKRKIRHRTHILSRDIVRLVVTINQTYRNGRRTLSLQPLKIHREDYYSGIAIDSEIK